MLKGLEGTQLNAELPSRSQIISCHPKNAAHNPYCFRRKSDGCLINRIFYRVDCAIPPTKDITSIDPQVRECQITCLGSIYHAIVVPAQTRCILINNEKTNPFAVAMRPACAPRHDE